MAKKVTMWEDDFGNYHLTKESAEAESLEARKKKLASEISGMIYEHMHYDEFLVYDFLTDSNVMIGLLEAWNKLNER